MQDQTQFGDNLPAIYYGGSSQKVDLYPALTRHIDRISYITCHMHEKGLHKDFIGAVTAFDIFLKPYHDTEYSSTIKSLRQQLQTFFQEEISKTDQTYLEIEFAKEQLGLLMELMTRHAIVPEKRIIDIID